MARVVDRIREFAAADLKYWEQSALDKISSGCVLDAKDYDELLRDYMMDAGLVPMEARPRLSFPIEAAPTLARSKRRLERLFNLRNVNALPEGQEIRFGPQLTLVFGDNGVGKTGYTRPLGCAAFGRGERDVLPDATRQVSAVPEAEIEISDGTTNRTVTWKRGQHNVELAGFYVFDDTSLNVHLTRSNSLSFSPSGLDLLTSLAGVTDEVRERLKRLIESCDIAQNFGLLFEGDSLVSRQIATLSAETNLELLDNLASLTDEEQTRIAALETQVAELTSQDIARLLGKRRQEVSDLNGLVKAMKLAEYAVDDGAFAETTRLVNELQAKQVEVERSGVDQFTFSAFTQVGTIAWREFVASAKALADAEAAERDSYPQNGDHCLLCRQPLPPEAVELLKKMWSFLDSDSQGRLEAARNACVARVLELQKLKLDYFAGDSGARRLLESELPTTVPMVESQISASSVRQMELIESLERGEIRQLSPSIVVDITDIHRIIKIREDEIATLERSDVHERLAQLQSELRELKHRKLLRMQLSKITSYIHDKRWVRKARQSLGSTRAITTKYNELFKELVTDRYAELFKKTLNSFKSKINVTIETRGQKGETVRQITLNPEKFPTRFPVERILSDGEKTAVALADFLTEAALDESCSGIILDDPVTSLDNNWKGVLASCLSEHARERQVVVFTHDLPFLYLMTESAKQLNLNVVTHWIREEDGHPGFVYGNNSPVCEKDFKSARMAGDFYSKAKDAEPAEQQLLLQHGFGALRTSYEALVIFELFNGVVARFQERISFDRLDGICLERDIVNEIVERMGTLSRHIIAHLHSDAMAPVKPTPALLFQEIEAFEALRKRIQNAKKKPQGAAGKSAQPSTLANALGDPAV